MIDNREAGVVLISLFEGTAEMEGSHTSSRQCKEGRWLEPRTRGRRGQYEVGKGGRAKSHSQLKIKSWAVGVAQVVEQVPEFKPQ
jgi:hypothetical protein